MSRISQLAAAKDFDFGGLPRPVAGLAVDYPAGSSTGLHHHGWDQLVYAAEGVMTVACVQALWVVPPQRAVCVPAHVPHELHMHGRVALRTLYLAPGQGPALAQPAVLNVSPLLREALLRTLALPPDYDEHGPPGRVLAVLLDELLVSGTAPLELPMPRDPRAARVAAALRAEPADPRTLAEWADTVGASQRTLARRFVAETGLAFGAWRQQARLLQSLQWLAEGYDVTRVALDLGYSSPSAFVAAFRRNFGTTPGRYFR